MIATHHAGIVWHVTITTQPGVRGDQEQGDVLVDIDLERGAEWDTEWSLHAFAPLEELYAEAGVRLMNLWPLQLPVVGRPVPEALAYWLFGYHKEQIMEGITDAQVADEVAGYVGETID